MGGEKVDEGELFEGSFDQLRDSRWLCSADIPWDKDTLVQIKEIRKHRDLQLREEKKALASTLVFVGKKKRLLLNAGHRAVLKALFGDAKGAQGGWVSLYVDPLVMSFGELVPAVRIRAKHVKPGKADSTDAPLTEDEMRKSDEKHEQGKDAT